MVGLVLGLLQYLTLLKNIKYTVSITSKLLFSYNKSPSCITPDLIDVVEEMSVSPSRDEREQSWRNLVVDFSAETTFHGLRFLFMSSGVFQIRR